MADDHEGARPGSATHPMQGIARRLLGRPFEELDARTRRVAQHVAERTRFVPEIEGGGDARATIGQHAADAVARFGGSWTFILLFAGTLVCWVALNTFVLARSQDDFDPYPYILLNLFLSMLAAVQAPIILMSQNRQSQKDRERAEHDYDVNLKAELEIMLLHEKVDELRERQWTSLMATQTEQLALLTALHERACASAARD